MSDAGLVLNVGMMLGYHGTMPLPTTPTWDLADFDATTIGSLLTLGGSVNIQPSTAPYFTYNADSTILTMRSTDGVAATLDLVTAVPAQYTVEITARFRDMPHNLGDLASRRIGLTVADDDGRGITIYFAKTGVAIARLDDFGSVTALENTQDVTQEISTSFRTIRVAVDSGAGQAYVMLGSDGTVSPEVRFILPVEATPPSVIDIFQLFAKGTATEGSAIDIKTLRLASGLVVPDFPPVADAGSDRVAPVGHAIRFDGRASYDAEGASLTYIWQVVDAPADSTFVSEIGSASTSDDGDGDGVTAVIDVPIGSIPVTASEGDVIQFAGKRGVVAALDNAAGLITATAAVFPDNQPVSPIRLVRQLIVGGDTETPYIVPDRVGLYRAELVVSDGLSLSAPSEVVASAVSARAPLGIEPDVSALWGAIGDEWQFVENRDLFQELWTGIAQMMAAKMLETWQYHYNFSIRDAQRVFQRKWVAFRTLLAEPDPDAVQVRVKYGRAESPVEFDVAVPVVTGTELTLELWGERESSVLAVPLSGSTLLDIVSAINTVTAPYGIYAQAYAPREVYSTTYFHADATTAAGADTDIIDVTPGTIPTWVSGGDVVLFAGERLTVQAVNNGTGEITLTSEIDGGLAGELQIYRTSRLVLRSSTRAFRVLSSTGATVLGLPEGFAVLEGAGGALVTDRTYYTGIDLIAADVQREDLLVLNNGQSFTIDSILTSVDDPVPNARVLLLDSLPADATETWTIPSRVESAELDFSIEGIYPGDVVTADAFATDKGSLDLRGIVVAQKGNVVVAHLEPLYYGVLAEGDFDISVRGLRRRKAIPLPADVLGIPRLQDRIPVSTEPTIYSEVVDYVLEPFYRDVNQAPIPMLQFRDETFIEPDLDPPDILWAEMVLFNNEVNVEALFGQLVGFLRDDATAYSSDFNYVAGVAGLLYTQQRGPSVSALRIGAQILLGQSFAEVAGVIEEIRNDYSPTHGRLLARDLDGNVPTQSEAIRTYYYKKLPDDTASTSGLAINEATGAPWAVGDELPQFAPIGAGVGISDLRSDPTYYVPYVRGGLMTEVEKFHHFLVTFDLDVVELANLTLLSQFISRTRPRYTRPLLVGLRRHEEDLDVTDEIEEDATMFLYDSPCGSPLAYMYDDYRGDGTMWSTHDDGETYYDARDDCPLDLIEFLIELDWGGGTPTYDSGFISDVEITDVTGAHTGLPGSTFFLEYDMTLAAGTYEMTLVIKSSGVVFP